MPTTNVVPFRRKPWWFKIAFPLSMIGTAICALLFLLGFNTGDAALVGKSLLAGVVCLGTFVALLAST